jgi:hypothetical protein
MTTASSFLGKIYPLFLNDGHAKRSEDVPLTLTALQEFLASLAMIELDIEASS